MKASTSTKPMPELKDLFKIHDLSELSRNVFKDEKRGLFLRWDRIEGGKSYTFRSQSSSHSHHSGETSMVTLAHIYKDLIKRWRYYLHGEYANSTELKSKGYAEDLTQAKIKAVLALIFNPVRPFVLWEYLKLQNNPTKIAVLSALAKEWGMYEDSFD